jgi:hypothetical protein
VSPALTAVLVLMEVLAEMGPHDPRFVSMRAGLLEEIGELSMADQVALYHIIAEDDEQRTTYLGPVGEA